MLKVLLNAIIALLAAPAGLRAHPPSTVTGKQENAMADEIVAWQAAFAKIVSSRAAAKPRELYAPSFVHKHGSGKQDARDARIASALPGDPVFALAPMAHRSIRAPGDRTPVATEKSPIKSLADNKTHLLTWMTVYVRASDGWQLAAPQATRFREIAPRHLGRRRFDDLAPERRTARSAGFSLAT